MATVHTTKSTIAPRMFNKFYLDLSILMSLIVFVKIYLFCILFCFGATFAQQIAWLPNPPYGSNLSDIYARTYGERRNPFPTSRMHPNATSSPRYCYVCSYVIKGICKGPSQKLEDISDYLLKAGVQHPFLRRRTRRSKCEFKLESQT